MLTRRFDVCNIITEMKIKGCQINVKKNWIWLSIDGIAAVYVMARK